MPSPPGPPTTSHTLTGQGDESTVHTADMESAAPCGRCTNPLPPSSPKAESRYMLRYREGEVFCTKESIHSAIKKIFFEHAFKHYKDSGRHIGVVQPEVSYGKPRPCMVLAPVDKRDASKEDALRLCLMGTFNHTAVFDDLPKVLRHFIVPVYPHASLSCGDCHVHTTPDWEPNRNTWILAYVFKTTNRATQTKWIFQRKDKPSIFYRFDAEHVVKISKICDTRLEGWIDYGMKADIAVILQDYQEYLNWKDNDDNRSTTSFSVASTPTTSQRGSVELKRPSISDSFSRRSARTSSGSPTKGSSIDSVVRPICGSGNSPMKQPLHQGNSAESGDSVNDGGTAPRGQKNLNAWTGAGLPASVRAAVPGSGISPMSRASGSVSMRSSFDSIASWPAIAGQTSPARPTVTGSAASLLRILNESQGAALAQHARHATTQSRAEIMTPRTPWNHAAPWTSVRGNQSTASLPAKLLQSPHEHTRDTGKKHSGLARAGSTSKSMSGVDAWLTADQHKIPSPIPYTAPDSSVVSLPSAWPALPSAEKPLAPRKAPNPIVPVGKGRTQDNVREPTDETGASGHAVPDDRSRKPNKLRKPSPKPSPQPETTPRARVRSITSQAESANPANFSPKQFATTLVNSAMRTFHNLTPPNTTSPSRTPTQAAINESLSIEQPNEANHAVLEARRPRRKAKK